MAICNRAESERTARFTCSGECHAVCVCEWQVHQLLYKFRDSTVRADKGQRKQVLTSHLMNLIMKAT